MGRPGAHTREEGMTYPRFSVGDVGVVLTHIAIYETASDRFDFINSLSPGDVFLVCDLVDVTLVGTNIVHYFVVTCRGVGFCIMNGDYTRRM